MNTSKRNALKHNAVRSILTVAVLGVLYGGSVSMAQFRVDNGHALDANTRVGSGGVNQVNARVNPWEISNAIVNGNISGGKAFRGNVQTGDSFAFRGRPTGDSVSDNFIRNSSGVSTSGVVSNNASNTSLYYGSSRAAPLSPSVQQSGLFQQTPTGAYTPAVPQAWSTVDPRGQSLSSSVQTLISPDSADAAGPVNLQYAPNALPVSSLGVPVQANGGALSDYTMLRPDTTTANLSQAQLSQIRDSVTGQGAGATPDAKQDGLSNAPGGTKAPGNQVNDAVQSSAIPTAGAVDSGAMNDSVSSPMLSNALPAQQSAEPGLVSKLVGSGGDSSSTYNSLVQRRSEQEKALRPGEAAEDSAKQFNDQIRARKAAEEKKNNADQPKPGAKPDAKPAGAPSATNKPDMPQPLHVKSLAGQGEASGVDKLLGNAEQQMRDGKFASAIDSYDAAEAVAPKNPLIQLGRTNAELGGSYYRRAEVDLRRTLTGDKNLLAGQYDLRGFLGDARLQIIQKDLSDQVQNKPGDVGSAVLLAYVYYNTGNERRAAAMLDLADKRAEGKDAFVTLLKTSWNFGTDNK